MKVAEDVLKLLPGFSPVRTPVRTGGQMLYVPHKWKPVGGRQEIRIMIHCETMKVLSMRSL